jgi:hypothetical protein
VDPPLPEGLALDPATGEIAGTPSAALPSTTYTVTMDDLAGTATATFTLGVAEKTQLGGGGENPGGGGGGNGPNGGGSGNAGSGGAGAGAPSPRPIAPPHLTLSGVHFAPRALTVNAAGKVRRARLVLRLSRPATVRLRIKGGGTALSLSLGRRPAGQSTLNLRARLARRALKPGRYRAVLAATAAGESARRTVRFQVEESGRGQAREAGRA